MLTFSLYFTDPRGQSNQNVEIPLILSKICLEAVVYPHSLNWLTKRWCKFLSFIKTNKNRDLDQSTPFFVQNFVFFTFQVLPVSFSFVIVALKDAEINRHLG